MQITNIHEAKTHFSKLIARVQKGEKIIIGKAGKPIATISAFKQKPQKRTPGLLKGKVWISDDFDDEDPEINKLFYGSEE